MTVGDDEILPHTEDIDNYVGDDARVKNILVVVDEGDDEKRDVDADIAVVRDAVVAASPSAVDVDAVVDEHDGHAAADAAAVAPHHHPDVVNASE